MAEHRALGIQQRSSAAVYHLLTGLVLPRPIAWITSVNPDGGTNLAPFSFFNVVCADPPLLVVGVARRDGEPKDTVRNLLDRPDFVVNLPHRGQAQAVQASAAELPYGESELNGLDLAILASLHVAAPRLADCPVQLECRLEQRMEIGNGPLDLLVGRILEIHVRADILDERGRPLAERIDPLARLGGSQFAGLDTPFSLPPRSGSGVPS